MSKSTILFVDDEKNVLNGLKRSLRFKRSDWEMLFANGGPEAIEILQTQNIDVIVSDMRMPEVDGADLLARAIELQSDVVRLILSGQSHRDKLLKILGTAHQFHSKPCDTSTLVETIEEVLSSRDDPPNLFESEVVLSVKSLPSQAHLQEELEMALEGESSVQEIYEIVRKDIGLVAKILQLVNSSFFDSKTRIRCLSKACQSLGKDLLKDIFKKSQAFQFVPLNSNLANQVHEINQRSTEVAEISRTIAFLEGMDATFCERAFLGGLLHNVGELVFAGRDEEQPSNEFNSSMDSSVIQKAGFQLLRFWGIDAEIANCCGYFSRPEQATNDQFNLLTCVHAAETIRRLGPDAAQQNLSSSAYVQRIGYESKIDCWIQETKNCSITESL